MEWIIPTLQLLRIEILQAENRKRQIILIAMNLYDCPDIK